MKEAAGSMRIHQMTRDSFAATTTTTAPKTRYRTTKDQLAALEDSFAAQSRPEREERERLSRDLGMSYKQVVVWFQNRRAKERNMARKAINLTEGVEDLRDSVPLESQVFEWSTLAPPLETSCPASPPGPVPMISPRHRAELATSRTLPISKPSASAAVANVRVNGRNSIQAPFGEWNQSTRVEISPRRAGSLPGIYASTIATRYTAGFQPTNARFTPTAPTPQYPHPTAAPSFQFAPSTPSVSPFPLLPQLRSVTDDFSNLPMPSAAPESFSDLRRYSLSDEKFQSMVPVGVPPPVPAPYGPPQVLCNSLGSVPSRR